MATHFNGGRPHDPLEPFSARYFSDYDLVGSLICYGRGRRAAPVDEVGDHLKFGEGSTHTVTVNQRNIHGCGHDHRHHRVAATHLKRGDGIELPAEVLLQGASRDRFLLTTSQLLVADHRRSHTAHRDKEIVICDLVGVNDPDPATCLHHLLHPQVAEVGVATASGTEHCGADGDRQQIFLGDVPHRLFSSDSCWPNYFPVERLFPIY